MGFVVYFGMGPGNDYMRHADGPIAVYKTRDEAHHVQSLFGGRVREVDFATTAEWYDALRSTHRVVI